MWRWEFLRRKPDYQQNWAAVATSAGEHDRIFWLREYGLAQPHDPSANRAPFFSTYRRYFIAPGGKGDILFTEIIVPAGKALIEIDLEEREQTIAAQLEAISWQLVPYLARHKLPRRGRGYQWQPTRWLKYLRLLDANESKAKEAEISSVLYPGIPMTPRQLSKRIYDDWKAARELLEFGYRRIRP
jgi:hypothetical protein